MTTQVIGVDVTQVDTSELFEPGTRHISDDGKTYQYIKILNETATVAGVAGDPVAYLGSPGATEYYTGVLDCTDAATKPVCAGVLAASVSGVPGTAEYAWLQITGIVAINEDLAGTTPADGDAVYLSTTDKTLTLAAAVDDPICAHIVDDSAGLVRLCCV